MIVLSSPAQPFRIFFWIITEDSVLFFLDFLHQLWKMDKHGCYYHIDLFIVELLYLRDKDVRNKREKNGSLDFIDSCPMHPDMEN
jgi:hypothetical protein